MGKYLGILAGLAQRCRRCCKVVRSLYKDSPLIFIIVLAVIAVIVLLVVLFSACVKRVAGSRGTIVIDLTLFWLFARFVARVLMFPGSFKLFQRNTEATFRTEMSRQYAHYLRQLWVFLRHAARESDGMLRGVTVDGIVRGCAVIETLTASFKMQEQQHEVKLSSEQAEFQSAAQDVQQWLTGAKVNRPPGPGHSVGAQPLLVDWLRQLASGMAGMSPLGALVGTELLGTREDTTRGLGRLEQLLAILDELRHQKSSVFSNTLRFFQVPTVGSLNQLRTELQMRYGGHRCWVPVRSRHRLDAMYIPCDGLSQGPFEDEVGREDVPLKGQSAPPPSFSGPVLIWCNPNAAYYETMVYQVAWLNFWLSRGINLFFFNYAGYGRSSGKPSPSRIAEDVEAVLRYLKSKGATQIGIYGRSIGGVAACHLARHHPDAVQLLIADRTMSTLESTAKYMYGSWASMGLKVTAMVADNVSNFAEVRAYKLLIVDPKDTMILDLASLRTAVALRLVERLPEEERLTVDDAALARLEEVWRFFGLAFAICESDDDFGFEGSLGQEMGRSGSARQPNFVREDLRTDHRTKVADTTANLQSPGSATGGTPSDRLVSTQWLEENAGLVRTAFEQLSDQVRSALDIVGEYLEGGGVTLNDVFADSPSDASFALRCMLTNLQVWGTLGDQREEADLMMETQGAPGSGQPYAPGVKDGDVEYFLRKDGDGDYLPPRATPARLAELGRVLAPEMITTYHRRLARSRVGLIRREFRRRLGTLQHAFTHAASSGAAAAGGDAQASEQTDRLFRTALHHLGEVESFVSTLSRFFKSVDLAVPYNRQQGSTAEVSQEHLSDSSDEKVVDSNAEKASASAQPQPAIDHSSAGYIMHIDCGHNGIMDEVDMRQLALHLRAARFGSEPGGRVA